MGYWDRTLATQINRRRALAATGAGALGAAFLAACGGGNSGPAGVKGDKSGLLTTPVDTSAKATNGGIIKEVNPREAVSLDPHLQPGRTGLRATEEVYDRLLFQTVGMHGKPGAVTGNAAESFELSPDGLTLTFRIRPNHVWDQRAPTSGRAMTAADVRYTWDRFISTSVFAGDLYAGKNKSAPVESITTPDEKTVIFKLQYPSRSILDLFSHVSYFRIMPTEAESKFDPRNEARGSGPFYIEKWTPGVGMSYRKNPKWWMKGRPFIDGSDVAFIPDYAAILAQFEDENLDFFIDMKQEDILRLKKNHTQLVMMMQEAAETSSPYLQLSQQPDSVMRDVRVRRAASMLIDRDASINVFFNTQEFIDVGIPIKTEWHSSIGAAFAECLRPSDADLLKQLGEGGKYYQFNVSEAKKLLSAAGYNGQKVDHFAHNAFEQQRQNEPMNGFLREGFNTNYGVLDQNTTWRQVCQTSGGTGHNGFCLTTASGLSAEDYIASVYLPEGKFAAFPKDKSPYPELEAMVRKMRVEVDAQKQGEQIKEIQRWNALNMPTILLPGYSFGLHLHWPRLENYGVFTPEIAGYVFPGARAQAWWYNKEKDGKAKAS